MKKFVCARCGKCCKWSGYVRLQSFEAETIAAYLKMPETEFFDRYTRLTADRRGLSLVEKPDGCCCFYAEIDGAPQCRINPVKPRQCRDFPLKWNFPGYEQECAGQISESDENNQ
ncbi:MAG: YkgJ family cysteine cluster protein [Victivallaceae bacterium]